MIETRFEAPDAAAVEALLGCESISGASPIHGTAARRVSVLFDTDDWALARARVGLELRRRGGAWELAVSWDEPATGGWRLPREVRQPLARAPRASLRLPPGPVADRVGAFVAGRGLRAVAALSTLRRRFDLRWEPSTSTGRPVTLRCRVDNVLAGPPGAIPAKSLAQVVVRAPPAAREAADAFVAALTGRFGLAAARRSHFERTLMLVHGDVPFLERSQGPVAATDPLGTAARKVLARHLRRVQDRDPGTRAGIDPEELHDMRVATRRLRASLRLFGPALAPAFLDRLARDLRWLGRLLGRVRDLDVQLERAAGTVGAPRPAPAYLRHLEVLREHARSRLAAGLGRRRYLALLADIDRFASGAATADVAPPQALDPAGPHAADAIDRAFRRLRGAGRLALEHPTAAGLHQVRIRAKRLRYALEFLEEAAGPESREIVARLTELQDLLGAHQDAVVGAAFARAWGRAEPRAGDEVATLVAAERVVAEECRHRFGQAWDRFAGGAARRRVERVVARLDPQRLPKKKGDAASGVP